MGAHLVTNGGDNEGLFRAGGYSRLSLNVQKLTLTAIMESGNAVGPPYNGTEWHQPMYDQIVNLTGYVVWTEDYYMDTNS